MYDLRGLLIRLKPGFWDFGTADLAYRPCRFCPRCLSTRTHAAVLALSSRLQACCAGCSSRPPSLRGVLASAFIVMLTETFINGSPEDFTGRVARRCLDDRIPYGTLVPAFAQAPREGGWAVTTPRSPTVRRRRLAAELHRLRGSRTGEEIARELGWSASKVSRYELGRTGLKPSEVERLLNLYGVVEPERSRLLALAYDATQKGWWEDYSDALPDEYMTFIGLETEAISVAHWEVDVVPGLLQTEQYATQVLVSYQNVVPIPPGIIQKRVKVRMLRQQALTREEPLDFSVVLDESVLLRRVAKSSVMHGQLLRMAELANLPNVRLQVLPLSAGRSVIASSFVIFRFGPAGDATLHDVVTTENFTSEFYVEGETNTYEHRLAFESLARDALAPTESLELIARTAEHVWT